jgi:hypothetical protein
VIRCTEVMAKLRRWWPGALATGGRG